MSTSFVRIPIRIRFLIKGSRIERNFDETVINVSLMLTDYSRRVVYDTAKFSGWVDAIMAYFICYLFIRSSWSMCVWFKSSIIKL